MSTPITDSADTLAIRVHMMPKDTNYLGTVFGGTILSLIDQAGFHEALRNGRHRWVTASIDAVAFLEPVHVGEIVTLWSRTVSKGRTSIRVGVRVVASRIESGEDVDVTEATLTMVAVDSLGAPIPWNSPPTAGRDAQT